MNDSRGAPISTVGGKRAHGGPNHSSVGLLIHDEEVIPTVSAPSLPSTELRGGNRAHRAWKLATRNKTLRREYAAYESQDAMLAWDASSLASQTVMPHVI